MSQPYNPANENYPRNIWWVAATSDELAGDGFVERKLLSTNVILFRKADGGVIAMNDRCIHRGLPLSMGWRDGDDVVCRYHGFRYSSEGKIVQIPTQPQCPKRAAIKTYQAVEKAPFIWIWMGDPDSANPADVADYPWLRDPGWIVANSHMVVKANYMLLKENVLDLTHFPFAHKSTFGALDDYESAAPEFVEEGETISFVKTFLNQPLSPIYDRDLDLGGKPVDRIDKGTSVSPAEHLFTATIRDKAPFKNERISEYQWHFQHLTTPETNTTHHYWWAASRSYGVNDTAVNWINSIAREAFTEDREILEAIQDRICGTRFPLDLPEVSAISDKGGLLARKQLQSFMDKDDSSERLPRVN